jgi:hypothetical protein
MKKIALVGFGLLLCAAISPQARASEIGQTCLVSSTAQADGCAGANWNAVFRIPRFFTCTAARHCALKPSQARYAALPFWNVAAVNYPVGYDKTLTFKDPSTAALPAGCAYHGAAPPISSSNHPYVECQGTAGLDLEGYDFGNSTWAGLTTGGGCVALIIAGNISGSITIKNNRFFNGADATYGAYGCNINNLEMVQVETNTVSAAVYILDNYCNLNIRKVPSSAPNGPIACFTTVMQASRASVTVEYNVCLNIFARCSQVSTNNGQKTIKYNYLEYISLAGYADHGEFDESSADSSCTADAAQSYNTMLQPAAERTGAVTSLVYGSSGANGSCYNNYSIENNTLIVLGTASAAIEVSYNRYKHLTFSANYIAPLDTEPGACIVETSSPVFTNTPEFAGNINMVTGNTIGGFGVCP